VLFFDYQVFISLRVRFKPLTSETFLILITLWRTSKLGHSSISYRVCHRFRLTNRDDYFRVDFDHFWIECRFLEAAGVVENIGLSLKGLKQATIGKFSLSKSVKRSALIKAVLRKMRKTRQMFFDIYSGWAWRGYRRPEGGQEGRRLRHHLQVTRSCSSRSGKSKVVFKWRHIYGFVQDFVATEAMSIFYKKKLNNREI